jgi:hypothetical protein
MTSSTVYFIHILRTVVGELQWSQALPASAGSSTATANDESSNGEYLFTNLRNEVLRISIYDSHQRVLLFHPILIVDSTLGKTTTTRFRCQHHGGRPMRRTNFDCVHQPLFQVLCRCLLHGQPQSVVDRFEGSFVPLFTVVGTDAASKYSTRSGGGGDHVRVSDNGMTFPSPPPAACAGDGDGTTESRLP